MKNIKNQCILASFLIVFSILTNACKKENPSTNNPTAYTTPQTSYSPKDTSKLKNKLSQPTSDSEKQDYVDTVEPLMNKKSIIPKNKDKFLDSFVDLDTRVAQNDFEPTVDLDDYKKQTKIIGFKKKESSDEKEKE
jgi:hypothetical protein